MTSIQENNQGGYIRIQTAIVACLLLLSTVIFYQYRTFLRKPSEPKPQQVEEFTAIQIFPQTLPILEQGFYEIYLDTGSTEQTLGKFTINDKGEVFNTAGQLVDKKTLLLPSGLSEIQGARVAISDSSDVRSSREVTFLSGVRNRDRIELSFNFDKASGSGEYMLATPSDDNSFLNERSGIWYGDVTTNEPKLLLPEPPRGWVYEGWITSDGQELSTGRFQDATRPDLNEDFAQDKQLIPSFPGSDFLRTPPLGLTFPLDLAGDTVYISLEPELGNSNDPSGKQRFPIIVLEHRIRSRAVPRSLYDFNIGAGELPTSTLILR